MVNKKVLAVVLALALVMIASGVSLTSSSSGYMTKQEFVYEGSLVVSANETAYRMIDYNATFEYYFFYLHVKDNATIRASLVSRESFESWLNGAYQPRWYELNSPDETYGLGASNPFMSDGSQTEYLLFSNPDFASKEVTFQVYKEKVDYASDSVVLIEGITRITIGVVAVIAVVTIMVTKHKSHRLVNKAL